MSAAELHLVGGRTEVPLVGGGRAPYVNLDFAASAPPLVAVRDTVEEFLPWYSSVHGGAGFKSQVSTRAYERARGQVAAFVNARPEDAVVFTRNTTDALNLLAWAVPTGTHVITFGAEREALPRVTGDYPAPLPWRIQVAYMRA